MKRYFLKLFIFLLMSTLIIAGCSKNTSSTKENNEKPKEVRILYATVEAGSEAIIDAAKKYESETGIKVIVDTFPYNNLQEKVFSELAQQSDYYDLIAVDVPWVPQIIQHLEPMTNFIKNTKNGNLLKLDDFIPKVFLDTAVFKLDAPHEQPPQLDVVDLGKITSEGFDIFGLPIQSNVLTVSYRKDLFEDPNNKKAFQEKYGRELAIPNTLDEYLEIAQFFTNPDKDFYGTTLMAKKHEASFVDYKSFLSDFGGSIFDGNMKPVFNDEKGVKALETYGAWINKYKVTPPGVTTYTWDEVATAFGSGKVAMAMNYHDMKLNENVDGEVGYFMFPGVDNGGEIVRGPHFGSWMLSINKYSKQKQAAYNLAEWLASPENQKQYLKFNQHVTRLSAYEAAKLISDPLKKEYYQVLGESLKVGVGRPRITNYGQVSETVQIAISNYLSGKMSAQDALDEAAKKVENLMKDAGYYK